MDEAQNLPVSAIEELRMLSNFQLGGQSLLQIFLLGQPEFRDLLKSHQLEQLRQRVIATHHLEPMMAKEVEPYIIHRLTVAGWVGNPTFTPAAFDALYAATGGVPRRLNALVSRVLLMGAIDQLREIDADVVQAVVADMGLDVDVAPEPVAPSPLDSVAEVEEAPAAEIADEADSEAVVEQEEAEATAPAPFAAPFAAPQVDESPVAEASPDAVIGEPFYTAFDAVEEPVEAWDAQEAEEEPEIMEPEMVESATFEQSQPEQIEPQPVATIDADQVDALRHDMLAEIEALRAEISSLRAVQAHVPFTPAQTVDPEALKDCFTLIEERLQSLEFRAEEQDTALRRVLTLLVDWVEREERMAAPRDSAAA